MTGWGGHWGAGPLREGAWALCPAHTAALRPQTLVVEGLPGTGKTTMVQLLLRLPPTDRLEGAMGASPAPGKVRFVAAAARTEAFAGPGLEGPVAFWTQPGHPAARLFWLLDAMRRLHTALPVRPKLPDWLDAGAYPPNAGATHEALDWWGALSGLLAAEGQSAVLVYDEPTADPVALIGLWLALEGRSPRIRARIFLQPEALERAQLSAQDHAALQTRTSTLTWGPEDCFRALAVRAHQAGLPELEGLFEQRPLLGAVPTALPLDGPRSARSLIEQLAPGHVGEGLYRSDTARWLINALRGRRGELTPAALNSAISAALSWQVERGTDGQGGPRLTRDALEVGVRVAAEAAVREIEAISAAGAAIRRLAEVAFPTRRPEVIAALGEGAFSFLLREGVLTDTDGTIDVRELFRRGLGLTRVPYGRTATRAPAVARPPGHSPRR